MIVQNDLLDFEDTLGFKSISAKKEGIVLCVHPLKIGPSEDGRASDFSLEIEAVPGKEDEVRTLPGKRASVNLLPMKNLSDHRAPVFIA